MITFVTLFLGLVLGPKQVDLLVEGNPAAVVLQLDGVEIDRKSGQPWSFDCDLGPRSGASQAGGAGPEQSWRGPGQGHPMDQPAAIQG